jgi:hypothetical protein
MDHGRLDDCTRGLVASFPEAHVPAGAGRGAGAARDHGHAAGDLRE